jgi:bifunctional N-acetylglucosamine-1-phosphate-uridyltransferase/glucosamine-1-phosphate-acetyltransferase GlmU-like protein
MSQDVLKFLRFEDIEWKDAPRGYYLTDVKQHTLWEDKKSGATLALVKFPKGVADKIHSHREANQIVIGLIGEAEMPNGIMPLLPNNVMTISKGVKHGATKFTKESILLIFWDGSPKPKVQ